ncbi:hydantoinase B/oxoprolinase family protein [Streptomyces sp. NBC_01210]|uniref:hydantoinase B/oxoprolinase family protein n=1 Tax=Streptomyces sp. NBC_01210 TaxID=2903774 RepID=UPI003FA36C06
MQYYETVASGSCAGDGFDGADAVQTHMTNSRLTDPEVLEWRCPVRVNAFAVRKGSGGRGRWSGGRGVVRRIRFLEPMTVALLTGAPPHPAVWDRGRRAGRAGQQPCRAGRRQRDEVGRRRRGGCRPWGTCW